MATKANIRLVFNSDIVGNTITLNIPRADQTANATAVKGSMDGIIAAGIVNTRNGQPESKLRADLVVTELTEYVF